MNENSNSTDRSTNGGRWWNCDSALKVDPEIMFSVHKNNTLVQSLLGLWKDQATGARGLEEALNKLEAKEEPERIWAELSKLQDLGFSSREEWIVALEEIREAVFNTTIKFKIHSKFEPDTLLMIDFSFLPQDFFFSQDHEQLSNIYYNLKDPHSLVKDSEKTSSLNGLTTIRGTLGFYDLGEAQSTSFKLHGPQEYTNLVKDVIRHFLVQFGGMPVSSELTWLLGFLYTYTQDPQDPHIDFCHKSMRRFREDYRNKSVSSLLPWSMDMPLTRGGLKLQFYGPEDCLDQNKVSSVVEVPARHVLLWRGDCVHSGGLLDLDGQPGFRMHGYLNLVPAHMPLTNSVLRTIDWRDNYGTRYENYLEPDEGEKNMKGRIPGCERSFCTHDQNSLCGGPRSMIVVDNDTQSLLV
jgi:hypothetical protein